MMINAGLEIALAVSDPNIEIAASGSPVMIANPTTPAIAIAIPTGTCTAISVSMPRNDSKPMVMGSTIAGFPRPYPGFRIPSPPGPGRA